MEKKWRRIGKGETIPTSSIIRPIDGGLPNITGSRVMMGQDCYYLSVDDAYELLKGLPLETEAEAKERDEATIIKKLIGIVKETDFLSVENRASLLDWLEKKGTPAELSEEEQNRFAKGVLTSCASSFINYLDAHKYEGKMCVSNGECEDIENAFHNAMWDRLHRYYCKYIEKQGEQKPVEDVNGDDYGIDSLWHAHRILEKTLGKVEGYQSDDGILEHECAISAVKKLYEQKPAWSEEDEKMFNYTINLLNYNFGCRTFLKSLKFRLLSPLIREFDKEDGNVIDHLIAICDDAMCYDTFAGCSKKDIEKYKSFLINLKFGINPQPQTTWKPSDEQMKVLDVAIKSSHLTTAEYDGLVKLREQLKKL